MAKNRGTSQFEEDIDSLFSIPVADFTGARNALAARLKKEGHVDEANQVKALGKPSIAAWAVNQLYWQHRKAYNELISTGQLFRKAQKAGKVADIHHALDARREALSQLTELATTLLRDAGHNPSPDTERRITTTLEALSVYASIPGGPTSGRLTHEVDPPDFDSLASLMSGVGMPKLTLVPPGTRQSPRSGSTTIAQPKKPSTSDARRVEEVREKRIAAAKALLQDAKRTLGQARVREQRALIAQKKTNAEARTAEKQRRDAEQRHEKARAASEFASRRAAHAAAEADEAARALEDARCAVEKASEELNEIIQQSS